jgi:hypothetical protein
VRDIEDLRKEFENFKADDALCVDGSCKVDEEVELKDYPSYTEVLYAKLIAPHASGIYISRWDIKDIALAAGESMAIHPRKRMFELVMKFATTKENMTLFLNALEDHMNNKIAIYEDLMQQFPLSSEVFAPKVAKAKKSIKLFPMIIDEYFE